MIATALAALNVAGAAGCARTPSPSPTPDPQTCWRLTPLDAVRFYPAPGAEAAMVGATIQGSNDSPMNGFSVLATISTLPMAAQWNRLAVPSAPPYRYVKYVGPPQSYGRIAEIELYGGGARLTGSGFGSAGAPGSSWENALDGDVSTSFSAATPSDAYVGVDVADGHVVAAPVVTPAGGSFDGPQTIVLATPTAGASLRYTTDGSDPRTGGAPYAGPFTVSTTSNVRAVASAPCMLDSPLTIAAFSIGAPSARHSTLHVGNSLTDTIDAGFLPAIAAAGGVTLDYARYTVPGAGTWLFQDAPTGGFGVANVRTFVATTARDHLTFQPFQNMPCLPSGGEATPGKDASDATDIDEAWDMAVTPNPDVQLWVYEAWPPTPTEGFETCITGGAWLRDPAIWNPAPPARWEDAQASQAAYVEAVRAALVSMHPARRPPYVVPAGRAVARLKAAVEAGSVPGVAPTAFWSTYFSNDGTDNHLTGVGRYLVTLVFYGSLFQADPRSLPDSDLGTGVTITAAQAAAYQQIAWDAIATYPLSGWTR